MEAVAAAANGGGAEREQQQQGCARRLFQMPLHYPRYRREDYEAMPEWQLDRLLSDYGLPVHGNLHHKRGFAMGAFLWGGGATAGH
ncbi:uncharacterized protein LOC100829892 [Brachypodium distachyon]|uniref:DUF7722 domain-containing protein n=1 Tax=Brachypodium distachyon TaxID=15368 RepID=I1HDD4_BRADI|nr:uncharacterized protein LOC100829892 [Brachypodium distachyon]KQK03342.1 hypothetical protein BRADI_2g07250v3 [Brachypodium distachyon]|eukprot:XP_010230635.1 uncharacterized protein LOC100829892 [Brachypodium distachyon]